ncbi:hypothetical protein L195_g038508 [Trifolium pratense]|uniref:Uncharacterized protein n=1 Tax=Trifolium pratense TaxID=57577 RepID=A0A2K3LVE0_TRIPR|nr:hypothetical protein L195_g038508 [Trifolium pratense]
MGFTRVELNIDSQAVVQVVRNGSLQSNSGLAFVKQIWRLLALDWIVEIEHSYGKQICVQMRWPISGAL